MTTTEKAPNRRRQPRQEETIKIYGRILKYHKCGRAIFLGDDGRFFAAKLDERRDLTYEDGATIVCPECGQELAPEDLDFSEEQRRRLGDVYAMLIQWGRERKAREAGQPTNYIADSGSQGSG